MDLRTTFTIPPSSAKITYHTPVIFIGSCFATSIGRHMEMGRIPVLINPFGTVYNPVSVINTLRVVADGKSYSADNIYNSEGRWISFSHYTDFTSEDPTRLLDKINDNIKNAHNFLSGAKFLFVTFGTAWIYTWNKTGEVVSNCHKLPASKFTRRLLSVDEVTALWSDQIERLNSVFPDLKVIFTVSPVRHWKDGAHGNQISKSVLLLAIEELQKHPLSPGYFPAYELVMDDLRDYRFYDTDMLHLSESAVEYVWDAFAKCFIDEVTMSTYNEVLKISRAVMHRIQSDSSHTKRFARNMIEKINDLKKKYPFLDLETERAYFSAILEQAFIPYSGNRSTQLPD